MSKQSEFYRWRPAEASLTENKDLNGATESFDMVFPSKLQLSYENRALLIELGQLEYLASDNPKGHYDDIAGINFLFDPEQYVDTNI